MMYLNDRTRKGRVNRMDREWLYSEYVNRENLLLHAPYAPEMEFYHAVQNGDLETVSEYLTQDFTSIGGLGELSADPLTNFKYHFVVTAALIARSCIHCGLPHEQAYSLSDHYIRKADRARKLSEIDKLHREMITAYTTLMKKMRADTHYSRPILKCVNYIYSHLHVRITLRMLAEEAGLSESYLSKLFRRETGMSITEYISGQKLETAANMLRFSDYTPGEIASILGYSSQSYFTERFRRCYGVSPARYRAVSVK